MAYEEGKDKNSETARPKTWELGRNKAETGRTSSHREWFLVLAEKDGSRQKRKDGRGGSGSFRCEHRSACLRQMESSLAFLDGDGEALLQNIQVTIIWQLQVVDAGHHTRKIVVWCIWMFTRATHNSEDRCETLETCN